jgi:hypothetical protein
VTACAGAQASKNLDLAASLRTSCGAAANRFLKESSAAEPPRHPSFLRMASYSFFIHSEIIL